MRLVERQNLKSTVPFLGSVPGLSWLFSRTGTSVQNRKILILIRAKIVIMEEHEPNPKSLPAVPPAPGGMNGAMPPSTLSMLR